LMTSLANAGRAKAASSAAVITVPFMRILLHDSIQGHLARIDQKAFRRQMPVTFA
jgi:hypothetical protein